MHTIEIIDGQMVLLDADGNGCEATILNGYRNAKRTIRLWAETYTLDFAECYNRLGKHFSA